MDTDLPEQPERRGRAWIEPASAVLIALAVVLVSVALPIALFQLADIPLRTAVPGPSATFLVFMMVSQATMLAGALVAAFTIGRGLGHRLALGPPRQGWSAYALGIALIVAVPTAINLVRHFVLGDDVFADLRLFAPLFRNPLWPLAFLIIAVGAPLAEEVLFRGYLLPRLMRFGFATAAAISTAIWAALHAYSLGGMVLVVVMGALLARMRERSGSLRVPIAAHAANNALVALYLQFGPPLS